MGVKSYTQIFDYTGLVTPAPELFKGQGYFTLSVAALMREILEERWTWSVTYYRN